MIHHLGEQGELTRDRGRGTVKTWTFRFGDWGGGGLLERGDLICVRKMQTADSRLSSTYHVTIIES